MQNTTWGIMGSNKRPSKTQRRKLIPKFERINALSFRRKGRDSQEGTKDKKLLATRRMCYKFVHLQRA